MLPAVLPAAVLSVPRSDTAFRAINFGYDYSVCPEDRGATYHRAASNYRMSDIAAAAVLMTWQLNWQSIETYMEEHDDEISNLEGIPFWRGGKGSFYPICLEFRRPRPNYEIKYYYYPLLSREEAPVAWRIFDSK